MIEQFVGSDDAHRRLVTALSQQQCVAGSREIAEELASVAKLQEFKKGDVLIQQTTSGTSLYLLVTGAVHVVINRREIARRSARTHVGEMSLIDPTSKRSASVVVAEDETVVAEIGEPAFSAVAAKNPQLWRALAFELAERLRERGKHIKEPNLYPVLFIGSSKESLDVVRAVQRCLSHDKIEIKPWCDGVFNASKATMEDLVTQVEGADFALMVLSRDDQTTSRETTAAAPRDNVIFELGLFMGALGRERTFMLRPRPVHGETPLKIPSDLLGITMLDYSTEISIESAVGSPCDAIRKAVARLGCRWA